MGKMRLLKSAIVVIAATFATMGTSATIAEAAPGDRVWIYSDQTFNEQPSCMTKGYSFVGKIAPIYSGSLLYKVVGFNCHADSAGHFPLYLWMSEQ